MGKREAASMNMTEGAIIPQILIFFLPILIGTFFQQLYNTVDAVIVGKFVGKEALGAVGGTTGHLINLFLGVFIGISSGFSVIISQQFGAKKRRNVSECVHTAMMFALISGGALSLAGVFLLPKALYYMNVPAGMIDQASIYLKIYFVGMVPNLIYNMGAAILRAVGDSFRPLLFLIISCFANIILDIAFVIGLGMGVEGAALATVLSQLLSALMVLAVLSKSRNDSYRLIFKFLHIHWGYLKKMFYIGIAAGFQSAMYTVSNIYIQSKVNYFGIDTIAAWTAYTKIDVIFWITIQSVGIAVTAFIGQNFGAGNRSRVKKGIRTGLGIAAVLTATITFGLLLFGEKIFSVFTQDPQVLTIALRIQRLIAPLYFTYIFIEIYSGALRGVGDCWVPMMMTGLGICVLRILWIGFRLPSHRVLETIIVSYPLSWFSTSLLFVFYMHQKSRLRRWLSSGNTEEKGEGLNH
ncbi:MAG: MATE family efflux transporter [Johnsonella sp.]|nr:MATE family efflux transporter [Johnsonella sp.]